jgi:hypothetical protein
MNELSFGAELGVGFGVGEPGPNTWPCVGCVVGVDCCEPPETLIDMALAVDKTKAAHRQVNIEAGVYREPGEAAICCRYAAIFYYFVDAPSSLEESGVLCRCWYRIRAAAGYKRRARGTGAPTWRTCGLIYRPRAAAAPAAAAKGGARRKTSRRTTSFGPTDVFVGIICGRTRQKRSLVANGFD